MISYKILYPTYDIDIIITSVLIGYILFEVGFFFYYKWVLIPHANDQITYRPSAPYRDYPQIKDREKLLIKILDRLDAQSKQENNNNVTSSANNSNNIYYDFIESWFQTKNEDISYDRFSEQFDMATLDVGLCPPKLNMAWSSMGDATSSSLDDDQTEKSSTESLVALTSSPEEIKKTNKGRIQKDNMDEFLSWAFFGLPLSTVQTSTDMQSSLDNFYNVLSKRTGLTFEPGNNPNYKSRSFTFERVQSLYRPYIVYIGVALLKMTADIILYILGFKQYSCTKGLRYWHRSSRPHKGSPFLFFHGIAPGGYAPYLPMIFGILKGKLSYRHRDVFLFENKPVSYALCFDALSEEDTIHGVLEAINLHLDDSTKNNLTLCGHSFGSCQIAWLIKSQGIKNRMSSIILCDPVSILLSAPDVVVNFLYRRQGLKDSYNGNPNTWVEKLIRFVNETKIHLVASSELFIEHYLRRNFAWYNSELWLQDIPSEVDVLVCLSDIDEIVNTPNIEREINYHNSTVSRDRSDGCGGCSVQKIIWKDVGHAHCMMSNTCFNNIHDAILRMERERNATGSKS